MGSQLDAAAPLGVGTFRPVPLLSLREEVLVLSKIKKLVKTAYAFARAKGLLK